MATGTMLDSFFAVLGFETDTAGLQEFTTQVEEGRAAALGLGAVLLATTAAVTLFVSKIAAGLDDLGDFAEKEQVAIEFLQEFGHAAQLNGSSMDAVKASITSVNKTLGEAALGIGRGAKTFEKLGFSAKGADGKVKDFDTLIGEVAKRMEGLSRQEQIAMAEKLGIDGSLVPLLAKGADALREYREEAKAFGVASAEDAQAASDFSDSLDRLKFIIPAIATQISVKLMPPLTRVLEKVRGWIMANKEFIKASIDGVVRRATDVIEFLSDWIDRAASGLEVLTEWVDRLGISSKVAAVSVGLLVSWFTGHAVLGFISQIAALVRWIWALNVAALVIPAVIGAVVAALALLADDFINFKEGNESILGDLVKEFPELLVVIETIEAGVRSFIDFWAEQWAILQAPAGEFAAALWDLVSVVAQGLWPVVKMVFRGLGLLLQILLPVLSSALTTLTRWIVNVSAAMTTLFAGVTRIIAAVFESLIGPVSTFFSALMWAADTTITFVIDMFAKWWGAVLAIYNNVTGGVSAVFGAMTSGISTAVTWALGLVDRATERVKAFLAMVGAGVRTVTDFLGLTVKERPVTTRQSGGTIKPAPTTEQAAPPAPGAPAVAPAAPGAAPSTRVANTPPVRQPVQPKPGDIVERDASVPTTTPAPGAPAVAPVAPGRQPAPVAPTLTSPRPAPGAPSAPAIVRPVVELKPDTAAPRAAAAATPMLEAVRQAPAMAKPDAPAAPARTAAARGASGEIGATVSTTNNRTVQNVTKTQTMTFGDIVVNSSDPTRAGESVREELVRMAREATRNGQSAVDL